MTLSRFIVGSLGARGTMAVVLCLISGAGSAVVLALLGQHLTSRSALSPQQLMWLGAGILTVLLCDLVAKREFIHLSARSVWKLRRDLARQILLHPFDQLERIGSARLLAVLTDDVSRIAQVLTGLPAVLVAITVSAGCCAALAWISPGLLAITCASAIPVVLLGYFLHRCADRYVRAATQTRDATFEEFRSLAEGIKELKLNSTRKELFLAEQVEPALVASQERITTARLWHQLSVSGSQAGMFLLLIGVLISTNWLPADPRVLTTFAVIILYIKSAIQAVLTWLPAWSEASAAAGNLAILGLSSTVSAGAQSIGRHSSEHDLLLQLKGLSFHYAGIETDRSFSLGPIEMEFRSGEITFVVGGNGCGKTTLMKLLIGLYAPDGGSIQLNGSEITDENREAYRQLFSVVFADFHLFERVAGGINLEQQTRRYLEQFQLSQHVSYSDGRLSTTLLSHGQRQRLALLIAYLEDRPIYVFDEWAANQDPEFRDVFYRQLLPDLKASGKLVIVITHDERYFDVADQLIRLADGVPVEQRSSAAA